MHPAQLPCAAELFAQWQRARGARMGPASRPFTRGWEDLLEEAGLVSAVERDEAERDARALANDGWLELKAVRSKPHLIDRVVLPLAAEARWGEAFGFVPPSDEEARRIRDYPWTPDLAFVAGVRLNLPFADLVRLNAFLTSPPGQRPLVPIKERSLEIFGDEKRLDSLYRGSALFAEGRLTLPRLCCALVPEPLPWVAGPEPAGPIIIIENPATWHSYWRWNAQRKQFSAVVYGCGNRFMDSVYYLADIFHAIGGPRRLLYFGDLDAQGLRIPQEASARAKAAGLPAVEPHVWSYCQLLALGRGRGQPYEGEPPATALCDWLGECAEPARQLFAARHRLAQEYVGWEFLRDQGEAVD